MARLSTREIHVFKKKLDELAGFSKDGLASLRSSRDPNKIVAWYRNGAVRRGRSEPWIRLEHLQGWVAWAVINREWEPNKSRPPLQLLAEAVDAEDEDEEEDEQAIYKGL